MTVPAAARPDGSGRGVASYHLLIPHASSRIDREIVANASSDVIAQQALPIPPNLEGLSDREGARLLAEVGANQWVPRDRLAWLRESLRLLLDPMAVMLAIAAVIYAVLGETRDAVVLALALIPVLGVDVLLEARSRTALAKLARAAAPDAEVVRGGKVLTLAFEEVRTWGSPRAARRAHGGRRRRHPVGRQPLHRRIVAYRRIRTAIQARVVGHRPRAARRSLLCRIRGGIGSRIWPRHHDGARNTLRQDRGARRTDRPISKPVAAARRRARYRRLGIVAGLVAVGLVPLSLARGDSWAESLLGAVSLAMAAIPEEFPIVLTLFLSVGAWRLASGGMLVRRLASVETLGSTTVIATDKTGTLTRGEFQVTEHLVLDPALSDDDFLIAAILACERHPVDGMERAIGAYAEKYGVSIAAVGARWTLVRDYDLDPIGKHMSHVWRSPAAHDAIVIAAKGAVEGVLRA